MGNLVFFHPDLWWSYITLHLMWAHLVETLTNGFLQKWRALAKIRRHVRYLMFLPPWIREFFSWIYTLDVEQLVVGPWIVPVPQKNDGVFFTVLQGKNCETIGECVPFLEKNCLPNKAPMRCFLVKINNLAFDLRGIGFEALSSSDDTSGQFTIILNLI